MTIEEKQSLHERITNAINSLNTDYSTAQIHAEYLNELYFQERNRAIDFHHQRLLLLEAQANLWKDDFNG